MTAFQRVYGEPGVAVAHSVCAEPGTDGICGGGRPSQEERAAVSLADLLKRADEVGYSCPGRCRRFMRLVSNLFGKEGAPLLHRALSDVNAVLNGPQSSHGEQAGKA